MKKDICEYYPSCPMKRFYEEGKLDKKWVENYCFQGGNNCRRHQLAAEGIPHPDNMLPNGEIDETLQ